MKRLAAMLVLSSATLSPAIAAETYPVIATGGGQGHGWVALKFSTDGSPATVNVQALYAEHPGSATGMSVASDGAITSASQALVVAAYGRAFLHAEPTPDNEVGFSEPTVTAGGYGAGVTFRYNHPGDGTPSAGIRRVLLFTTGTSGSWQWSLSGDPGVELLGFDTGDRTFSFMSSGFEGTLNAGAYVYGTGARAHFQAEKRLSALDGFAGVFTRLPTGSITLTDMTGPDGVTRNCDCTWGPMEHGPGDYRFTLNGGGAGLTNFHEVFLGLADARLVL